MSKMKKSRNSIWRWIWKEYCALALVPFSLHLHTRPPTLINLKIASIVIFFNNFFLVPSKVCLSLQGTFVIGYNCVIFPQVAFIWQVHYPLPPAKDLTGRTLTNFVNILFSEPLTVVLTETLSFSIVSFTHHGHSLLPNSHKSRQC